MSRKNLRRRREDLLRHTRQLKEQLVLFKQSAQENVGPLDKSVSAAETEAMVTPRANVLGTLENLLNQDLPDLFKQLAELDGLLPLTLSPSAERCRGAVEPPRRAEP